MTVGYNELAEQYAEALAIADGYDSYLEKTGYASNR
jgi:hypothetical protein